MMGRVVVFPTETEDYVIGDYNMFDENLQRDSSVAPSQIEPTDSWMVPSEKLGVSHDGVALEPEEDISAPIETEVFNISSVPSETKLVDIKLSRNAKDEVTMVLSPVIFVDYGVGKSVTSKVLNEIPQRTIEGKYVSPTDVTNFYYSDTEIKIMSAELINLHQFPPDHVGFNFPFDPGSCLHTLKGSNVIEMTPQLDSKYEDEANTGNNVARVVGISPLRDKTGYSVVFANQVSFMSNAFRRLVKIEFSFDSPLWLHIFPFFHISLDEFCGVYQNRVSLDHDFGFHKCNWVDTGQEHILLGLLLSDRRAYKNCYVLSFSLGGVTWLGRIMGSRMVSLRALRHFTFVVQRDEEDRGESIGKELTISSQGKKIVTILYLGNHFLANEVAVPPTGRFNDQYNLSQFSFDPSAKFFVIPIHVTSSNLCVWDPGISFEAMALSGYPVNAEALQLQGCSGEFRLIRYSNSMSRVWDPGQSWCVNPYILQPGLMLAPNFTHVYIVERALSSYLTALAPKANVLTWRKEFLILSLPLLDENKVRHLDTHTLGMCVLTVIVLVSCCTLLLWRVDSGLAPTVNDLSNNATHFFTSNYAGPLVLCVYFICGGSRIWLSCSLITAGFRLPSILLILVYFHRRKSDGLDTKIIFIPHQMFMTNFVSGFAFGATKPPDSTSSLISTQLILLVGLGQQNCTAYSLQVVVLFMVGGGIFSIGADTDMPTRKSLNDNMIVPWIAFWIAGNYSLSIPWYTLIYFILIRTLSTSLVLSTYVARTLRKCHQVSVGSF